MRRFLQTIVRGYGWRLGAIAATLTVVFIQQFFK